jgi:hypothetical protein
LRCLGLEACFGFSLLGADTGQIRLQLPKERAERLIHG